MPLLFLLDPLGKTLVAKIEYWKILGVSTTSILHCLQYNFSAGRLMHFFISLGFLFYSVCLFLFFYTSFLLTYITPPYQVLVDNLTNIKFSWFKVETQNKPSIEWFIEKYKVHRWYFFSRNTIVCGNYCVIYQFSINLYFSIII